MEAEKLEMPVFEEVRGGFMATIKREKFMAIQKGQNVTSPVTSSVGSLSVVQLTDRQKENCKMINNSPRISVKEMSLVLSLVERTIKRDLVAMQKMGVLLREGNTSAGHWVIIDRIEK